VLRWLINPAVILFTILYLPIGLNSNIKTSIFKINPFFSFIIFLGLLVSLIFPIYYAYGVGAPARAENVIYWFFLVGWFYNVQVFINFFKSKYAYSIKIPFNLIGLSILIVLFLSTESNIRIAYKDILSGTAFKYNWELLERYKLINESKNDTIEIDCIRNIPKTIFFRDLTYSDYLENGFSPFSKYFNKKMIRLRKEIIDMEKQKIFLKKELNKFEKKCCPEGGG